MIFGMPSALFPAFGEQLGGGAGHARPALRGAVRRRARRVAALGVDARACGGRGSASASPRRRGASRSPRFGFATALPLALVMLAAAGAADFVSAVLRSTILLQVTPDSMRGRLSGIELAQVAGTPALGNLEAGIVASLTSLRFAIVSGGVLCVAGTAIVAAALPAFRPLRAGGRANDRPRVLRARSVHEVAPDLIGVTLLVDGVGGRIVEVEAYDHEDPAAHGFRGRTRAERVDVRPARATRTSTARTGSTGA